MRNLVGVAVLMVGILPSCSSDEVKRAACEAVYQKGCVDSTGLQNCDPWHLTYDEYRIRREGITEPGE